MSFCVWVKTWSMLESWRSCSFYYCSLLSPQFQLTSAYGWVLLICHESWLVMFAPSEILLLSVSSLFPSCNKSHVLSFFLSCVLMIMVLYLLGVLHLILVNVFASYQVLFVSDLKSWVSPIVSGCHLYYLMVPHSSPCSSSSCVSSCSIHDWIALVLLTWRENVALILVKGF